MQQERERQEKERIRLERMQALEKARKKAEEEAAARRRAQELQKQQAEEESRKKKEEEKEAVGSTSPAISSNESQVEFDSHLATIEVAPHTHSLRHFYLFYVSRSSQMYSRHARKIPSGRKLVLT